MPNPSHLWSAFICVGIAVTAMKLVAWRRKVKMLPPGPPKLPFIDNLHNMPNGLDWVRFSELSKQHNTDILHLGALGQSIVVLNSYGVARELLDKRSGIYSSRPSSVMFELSGLGWVLATLTYGDWWRDARRMFTTHLGFGNAKIDHSIETFHARRCLKQLLDDPKDFRSHIQHLVGSIAISMAYGLEAQPTKDPNLDLIDKLMVAFSEVVSGGVYMVDSIPALRYIPSWVPGASFQKLAQECRELSHSVRNALFDKAVEAMSSAEYSPNLVSAQLQGSADMADSVPDIEMLKDVAASTYAGAADTTLSALMTFFLAMVCYPDVQKKAQEELDSVLNGQLPEHADIAQLPYLTAIFMEVSRWKPVAPIGMPHLLTEDDLYEGYLLPKGSVVAPNQWAMLNDPAVYHEPFEFNPDRFLKDGKIDESIRNPLDIAFGFGRRVCPGRHKAQSTFMITAASVLSTFDLLMAKDEKGQPIRPNQEYHLSLLCHPKPFPCFIVPRSSKARDLVETWATTNETNSTI